MLLLASRSSGCVLNLLVHAALGNDLSKMDISDFVPYYSESWQTAGEIFEREREAFENIISPDLEETMRRFVIRKLGDKIRVPSRFIGEEETL